MGKSNKNKKKGNSNKGAKPAAKPATTNSSAAQSANGKFKVNIVVPMAGRGSRFANEGFVQPKPLIDVGGQPMITHVLDNVDSDLVEATFILMILKEHDDKFNLRERLRPLKPRMEFVLVDQVTEGAACTVLLSEKYIDTETPMLVVNSDQFVEWDVDAFWRQLIAEGSAGVHGNVLCFHIPMEENDIKWSYAAVDGDGYITDLQEKKVISPNATVGIYYWKEGRDFVSSAKAMIKADVRVKGEFYVAPVYNFGVLDKKKYSISFCQKMWGLGVPADLVAFLSDYLRPRRREADAGLGDNTRSGDPMRFIAHRGNVEGADPAQENKPEYIMRAMSLGFDVELDVWRFEDKDEWWLGHDEPQYKIDFKFLLQPGLWIHCKNGAALKVLGPNKNLNVFFHDTDDYTITSRGWLWVYPDKALLGPNSIAVMFKDPFAQLDKNIFGMCQDNVGPLRRAYIAQSKALNPKIKLVVFDLDGVLVDSCDLHYEALNKAIEEVVGAQYVINRTEHHSIYDGLSTNQKLTLLMQLKEMPGEKSPEIWKRKQDLTLEFIKKLVKPTEHILHTLRSLKKRGYPVACASNCIRQSVEGLLEAIGAMPFIDVYVSNEDVVKAKPEGDIYLKTCDAFKVLPTETMVVEDSVKGFEAAVRAGCSMCRVSNPNDTTADRIFARIRELEAPVRPIQVVIPLAGAAPEFFVYGPAQDPAAVPMFLADAGGRPTLEVVIKALMSQRFPMRFIFLVDQKQNANFKLESLCVRACNYLPTKVIPVAGATVGAIQTVLNCEHDLDADAPLLVADGRHVSTWAPGMSIDDLLCTKSHGAVAMHQKPGTNLAHIRLLPPPNVDKVAEIITLRPSATPRACTGTYFFRKAGDFLASAKTVVEQRLAPYSVSQAYNEMIKAGQSVEAVTVENFWRVGSLEEISKFVKEYFPLKGPERLSSIYDEMQGRHAKIMASEGAGHDALLHKAGDPRRCLAAYTLCEEGANFRSTPEFRSLQADLRKIVGEGHCHYAPRPLPGKSPLEACLHFTFMQLIGFDTYEKIKPTLGPHYLEVMEATLQRIVRSFEIFFSRVIVTKSNVLLVGFPSGDVNNFREQMRRACKNSGLPLFEPYKNDIVHMTILRFASPLTAETVAAINARLAALPNEGQLASLTVEKLTLSAASWRMQDAELADPAKRDAQLYWES